MPTACQLVPTIPYAPCGCLARYCCAACDARIYAGHTVLHREELDNYKVGFICLNCSLEARSPYAEACIMDYNYVHNYKTYHPVPDNTQLSTSCACLV